MLCKVSTRRAYTLIEMVAVMGIGAIMLGIGISMIHLLLAADREQQRAVRTTFQMSRLSRQLRDDIHAAAGAEVQEAPQTELALTTDDGRRIVYTADAHVLTRIAPGVEDEMSREDYRFPPETTLWFSRDEKPALVRLSIGLPARNGGQNARSAGLSRPATIEALLGRDRRMAGGGP